MKTDIQCMIEKKVIECGMTYLGFKDGLLKYGRKIRTYAVKATDCQLSTESNQIINYSWFIVHIDANGFINDLPWQTFFKNK